MTRPKDNNKRRVILDLSYPKGNSLNDYVDRDLFDGSPFKLKFPSIDDITQYIATLNDPLVAKIDVSRAFRNLRIDPADTLKLGFQWRGKFYVDGYLAFGFLHGSASYQLVSDFIAWRMNELGFTIFPYLELPLWPSG